MTNATEAQTLSRLISEDCEQGHYVSAKEHLVTLSFVLEELSFEQSMAALDRRIADMTTVDLEELLQGGGIK